MNRLIAAGTFRPDTALPPLSTPRGGEVWLVGAGPGDPGLLTLQGHHSLLRASVVVHDRLGCEEIVHFLPGPVRRIAVGKTPGAASPTQEEIARLLIEEARAGEAVVRLKGGDPFVFGRGMEEVLALREAGIPCRIVPGISSSIAAPAAAGIPVTHRGTGRSFRVSTGWTREGAPPPSGTADTHVFLMGMRAMASIVEGLLGMGVPAETPAAVVSNAATYRQRSVRAALGTVGDEVRRAGLEPPAVLVVGETASFAADSLPETIVVTGSRIPEALERHYPAARWLWRPVSRREPLGAGQRAALRPRAEAALSADWILFNSPPAVEEFFRLLSGYGWDARRISARLAVVGTGTAAALEALRLVPDLAAVAGEPGGLRGQLLPHLANNRVVFPRGDDYHGRLAEELARSGAAIEHLPVYRVAAARPAPVDWRFAHKVFFPSPSTVAHFAAVWPGAPVSGIEAICLGESAAARARQAGFGTTLDLAAGDPAPEAEWFNLQEMESAG